MSTFSRLSHDVIGAAFRVHNRLGAGFREAVYQVALALELRRMGYEVEVWHHIQVYDLGCWVGEVIADLLVEGHFVIETKAAESIQPGHEEQCRAYLRSSGETDGLVLNFGRRRVSIRVIRQTPDEKASTG